VRDSVAQEPAENRIQHLPPQVADFVVPPFLSLAKITPKTVGSLSRLDGEWAEGATAWRFQGGFSLAAGPMSDWNVEC
jgi:hypothetical protein